MRMRHAAVLAGLALVPVSGTAQAAYILNIDQVGANVVATGSGSIDTSQLQFLAPSGSAGAINGFLARATVGSGGGQQFGYIMGPQGWTGDIFESNLYTRDVSGAFVQIDGVLSEITVPYRYVSGSQLGVSTATFNDVTLTALGLVPGSTFQYLWPGNAESMDTFTVNVGGISTVPLPSSAPMFGAALLALSAVGYSVKRKKAATAA